MNLFSNLQEQYDQLWKYVIRPKRNTYPDKNLGPQTFQLQGKKIKRVDFQVQNPRGHVLFASHFIPLQQQSYPCVVYMHGNSSNRTEGMEYLGHLMRLNISLCTFDFSGCGNSEGDYVSLGYYEQYDLNEIINYIRKKPQITTIGIWGRSMGAVTALLYLKKSTEISKISAAIFDSPFKSLKILVQDLCKKNSKIPTIIIQGALKIIASTIAEKAKFDIYKINPIKYEVRHLSHPAFFIVGKQDDLIPSQHTIDLFENYKGQNKYLQTVKGNHNDSRPEQCIQKVLAFLIENLTDENNIKKNDYFIQQKNSQKHKQFDFFNDEEDEKIENSSKQTQNIDFFSQQFTKEVKNYQSEFDEINLNFGQKYEHTHNNVNFSLSSMFTNIFSTNLKQSNKPRQLDGFEKLIEKVSKQLLIQETQEVKRKKQESKKLLEKKTNQIKQMKTYNFLRQILQNLDVWAF